MNEGLPTSYDGFEKRKPLRKDRFQLCFFKSQVCMLTARLAAAESMTHDVIRDLMGVKLDLTNHANLIDQEQLLNLLQKRLSNNLKKAQPSWIKLINQRKADVLASEIMMEGLQQREQICSPY